MDANDRLKNWEDLDVTREEIEDLTKCLKQEEFRKLLIEYAEEVTNPDNRKLYEKEICELERERGIDVTFVNPEPGYVIKTSIDGVRKCFINISKSDKVGRPTSQPSFEGGSRGLQWSIPFSLAPPRDDVDKKKEFCTVFDVVFHPDTLYLAEKNSRFRDVVESTAFDGVEGNFKVKIDRNNLKYPKLSFKGISQSTVIRKKLENPPEKTLEIEPEVYQKLMSSYDETREKYSKKYSENSEKPSRSPPQTTYSKSRSPQALATHTTPKFIVKHQTDLDLQDFQNSRDSKLHATVPKNLVVVVELPLLRSADDATLDVQEKLLTLKSEKPAKYYLELPLSHRVNPDEGNAKFDSKKRQLIVTLPVIRAFPRIHDDSGVESDHSPPTETENFAGKTKREGLISEISSFSDDEMSFSEEKTQFFDEKTKFSEEKSQFSDEKSKFSEEKIQFSEEKSQFSDEKSKFSEEKSKFLEKMEKNQKNLKHKKERKAGGKLENGKTEESSEENLENTFTVKISSTNTENSKKIEKTEENSSESNKIDQISQEFQKNSHNSKNSSKIPENSEKIQKIVEIPQEFQENSHNSKTTKNSENSLENGENCFSCSEKTFLNSKIKYSLPQFTLNIFDSTLAIVLHVKNVEASSISHEFLENSSGIRMTFSSMGAGFFPMYYALCLKISSDVFDEKSVSVEPWDNNVIVTVILRNLSLLKTYKVGVSEDFMEEKDLPHVVSSENKLESLKTDEISSLNDRKIEVIAENDEVVVEIGENHADSDDEEENPKKSEEKQQIFTKSRSISESSGDELSTSTGSRQRGILKYRRKTFSRSVSESSIDDTAGLMSSVDFNYDSVQELNSESESCSFKKTVRFSDVVSKQLFRSNSSILGRRKKNQRKLRKKKQAHERRMSESENSETEDRDKYKLEPKESPVDTNNTENVKPILNRDKHHSKSQNHDKSNDNCSDKSNDGAEFKNDLIFDLDM